jgi:hypothetical protein
VTPPETESVETKRPLQTIPQQPDKKAKAPISTPDDGATLGSPTNAPSSDVNTPSSTSKDASAPASPKDATTQGKSGANKGTDADKKTGADNKTGVDKSESGPDMKLQLRTTLQFSGRTGLSVRRMAATGAPVPQRLRSARIQDFHLRPIEKFAGPSIENLARN